MAKEIGSTVQSRGWRLLLVPLWLGACATTPGPVLHLESSRVTVDLEHPHRRRFGELELMAALALRAVTSGALRSAHERGSAAPRADHTRFGGLSGLELAPDGTLFMISDRGYWVEARLEQAADGTLTGLSQVQIHPLLDTAGRPVRAPLHDAESITRDVDGSYLVGFEWNHRIWRYRPDLAHGRPVALKLPAALAGAPGNGSLESLTVLPDGRLLFICEHYENPDGTLRGWVGREGAFSPVSYVASDDFVPTDLAVVPGTGQVLVLERAFSLLRMQRSRIRVLSLNDLRPGARLEPRELVRLGPPLQLDNFEGLAVQRHASGILLYLVSDDNFSRLQRTLLYQFRLRGAGGAR